jgi:hypothetical protein
VEKPGTRLDLDLQIIKPKIGQCWGLHWDEDRVQTERQVTRYMNRTAKGNAKNHILDELEIVFLQFLEIYLALQSILSLEVLRASSL